MKERPILFSGAMVRALLDGRKTQTRRVVKLPHNNPLGQWEPISIGGENGGRTADGKTVPLQGGIWHTRTGECLMSPYGQPGDRLWVRETWAQPTTLDPGPTFYRADYPACVPADFQNVPPVEAITWKPSIYLPRALSRITLEVTGVRVERLQGIRETDAQAEGVERPHKICKGNPSTYVDAYAELWESLNAARGYGWHANPWVWVVEFQGVS
jgi:hypothetical protein